MTAAGRADGERAVTLAAAGWEVAVWPWLGGAIASCRSDGADVLRATAAGATDPLDTACFALVPYANRIAHGRFRFAGVEHRLRRNVRDHPHALHGVGWQRRWTVAARSATSVTLVHSHDGDVDWPWRYRAEQRIALDGSGLSVALSLTNAANEPMPAGLGLHPYFPAPAGTQLRLAAATVWQSDATLLPVASAPAASVVDWTRGAAVAQGRLIDHTYQEWDGQATITHGEHGGTTRLSASGARGVHVYAPPGEAFCCVEPVSHLPDAINRPDTMTIDVLAPGGTLELAMRIAHAC